MSTIIIVLIVGAIAFAVFKLNQRKKAQEAAGKLPNAKRTAAYKAHTASSSDDYYKNRTGGNTSGGSNSGTKY